MNDLKRILYVGEFSESFQDNNYKLQYNENGKYFGSFIGINNNMKIYILTLFHMFIQIQTDF